MRKIPDPNKMRKIRGPVLTKRDLASAKVRITTYLDNKVLDQIRKLAQDSGSKYQTILNQVLRDALFGQQAGLIARINRLEGAVFRKRAA